MPTPPGCIPLSEFFHQLVRAQNIESTVLSLPLTHTMRYFLRQPQFFFGEADFLFSSIHLNPPSPQTPPSHPIKSNIPYWYCPHCTPSLTLPPSSLKCLQKSNPSIHRKCFRCFKCFGCFKCFMFAFGPQNRPVLVQIRTNPKNRHPPTSAI